MPSGFQQSVNQLSPNFYRITIDLSGYPATATSTTSGAIEPFDADSYATAPSSNNNSIRRARGNIRWNNIIMALSGAADCQILDVTASNGGNAYTNANTVSDALSFTVKFERDDFVLQKYIGTVFTPTTGGAVTVDSVAKAIRYIIGQSIITAMTRSYRTISTTQGEMQQSVTIAAPDVIADIYDTVSSSLIDTTTLVTTDYP
jgi:hypothetical protein